MNATISLLGEVVAGFPNTAENYTESELNLHEHVVKHPVSTFFLRAKGDSMKGVGIFTGDLVVVDRSISPISGAIVVASFDGEFTLKSYRKDKGVIWLDPANPRYKSIKISKESDFEIWGVVTHTVRDFLHRRTP